MYCTVDEGGQSNICECFWLIGSWLHSLLSDLEIVVVEIPLQFHTYYCCCTHYWVVSPFGCLAWFTSGERLAVVLMCQKDLVHARTWGHLSLAYVKRLGHGQIQIMCWSNWGFTFLMWFWQSYSCWTLGCWLKHKQEDIKQMHCMVARLRKLMLLSIHEFTDFGESQIVCAISCCLSASVPILSNRNWWSCSFLFLLLCYQQWVYLIRVMRPFYYSVFKPGGFKSTSFDAMFSRRLTFFSFYVYKPTMTHNVIQGPVGLP